MKTRVSLFIFCIQMIAVCGFAADRRIDGNGNPETREIKISDYDEITFVGSADFEYEQSDKAPYLSVTIDENLFDYLVTEVEGGTLKIYPKSIKKGFNNNSYDLRPTVYKIKSNSKELKELNTVGSGSFIISKPTKVNRMEINMAGSGNVELRGPVKGYKLECNMAGSGNIIAKDIQLDNLSCSLASSGEIEVIGTVDRASFNVAGSGEIKAFDCQARKAECNIASSGEISVYATQILDANIVGSGEIHYKGDPEISKSIMGSGSRERGGDFRLCVRE